MNHVPRIAAVDASSPPVLIVTFLDGTIVEYDCTPLLMRESFKLLQNAGFFRAARVDAGGYGISWNDAVDLSEYELWHNGKVKIDSGNARDIPRHPAVSGEHPSTAS